jgi:hypothetical protein
MYRMRAVPGSPHGQNEGSLMLPSWRDVALWVWCQKALGHIELRRICATSNSMKKWAVKVGWGIVGVVPEGIGPHRDDEGMWSNTGLGKGANMAMLFCLTGLTQV